MTTTFAPGVPSLPSTAARTRWANSPGDSSAGVDRLGPRLDATYAVGGEAAAEDVIQARNPK